MAKKPKIAARYNALLLAAASLLMAGCHWDMWDQPKFTTMQKNTFFANGSAARQPVAGTIPYAAKRRGWSARVFETLSGQPKIPGIEDELFTTGKLDGVLFPENYFPTSLGLIERGQARFNISCKPCHGLLGDGKGIVTLRGFPSPPSYHIERLREVEDGYIFDVISNGFGRMYSYASRVAPEDRWAIAAYIRALQYSQNPNRDELEPEDIEALDNPPEAIQGEEPAEHNAH